MVYDASESITPQVLLRASSAQGELLALPEEIRMALQKTEYLEIVVHWRDPTIGLGFSKPEVRQRLSNEPNQFTVFKPEMPDSFSTPRFPFQISSFRNEEMRHYGSFVESGPDDGKR